MPREELNVEFKSSFKSWIRVIAFILVLVFIPEQVVQAVDYDLSLLWKRPATLVNPAYLNNVKSLDIPLTIKRLLLDVSNKNVNAVKLSPTQTLVFDKPLTFSKERIEEIYNWLKGKPCGSLAIVDLLSYLKRARANEQDAAVLALTVDILHGVVVPQGAPKVIKNSLFALSKVAEFYGIAYFPAQVEKDRETLQHLTPFIAHFSNDHYVLVMRLTAEKAYVVSNHKRIVIPMERFLQEFTGNALIGHLVAHAAKLSDAQAKSVMGAGDNSTKIGKTKFVVPKSASTSSFSTGFNQGLSSSHAVSAGNAAAARYKMGAYGTSFRSPASNTYRTFSSKNYSQGNRAFSPAPSLSTGFRSDTTFKYSGSSTQGISAVGYTPASGSHAQMSTGRTIFEGYSIGGGLTPVVTIQNGQSTGRTLPASYRTGMSSALSRMRYSPSTYRTSVVAQSGTAGISASTPSVTATTGQGNLSGWLFKGETLNQNTFKGAKPISQVKFSSSTPAAASFMSGFSS